MTKRSDSAGRRGNGEGTIEKRGSSWRAQVVIGGRRHSITGGTKQEVKRRLREVQVNADKGLLPPSRITVQEYMEQWLEGVARPGVRDTTHRSYEQLTRLYVVPVIGRLRLSALQPGHVQKLHAEMQARGLSRNTVQRTHRVLHNALNRAVQWGYLPRNVATVVHPPTPKRGDLNMLDVPQVKTLLETAIGTRWEALIAVAVGTSLREGELLGLKWEDIDFDAGILRVQRQLATRTRRFVEPKTDSTRRGIHLPEYALVALSEHRLRQNRARLADASRWEDHGLVFATHAGRPLGARNVVREFKRLLKKGDLPDIRFHDLRHTAATLMLLQGVPIKVVQERLGHSQVGLTLNTYSHVLPSMDKEAASRLDALLG